MNLQIQEFQNNLSLKQSTFWKLKTKQELKVATEKQHLITRNMIQVTVDFPPDATKTQMIWHIFKV